MSLFNELKRRSVIRIAVAYAALSWLIIQVVETLFPLYGLSDAAARAVVTILAIGFIPALILAWIFEWTPQGIKLDSEVDRDSVESRHTSAWFDRLIIVVLVLALGYFAFDKFVLTPQRQSEELTTATEQARQEGRAEAAVESYGDKSIAVMPFVNLSSDPEQEYLGDGIAEELLNLLARIPQLRVISRSSAFSFKGKNIDLATIARQLNVAHILEGSIRKSGNRIRITAQLIEARSDTHLWSETYDRPLDDIFAIQDEVSAQVVTQLRLKLLDGPPRATPVDPVAYALVVQARQIVSLQKADEILRAEAMLKQALEIDPTYVDAITMLVGVYSTAAGDDQAEFPEKRQKAMERALQLEPDNPTVKTILAMERMGDVNDYVGAARLFEEAAIAAPRDEFVLFGCARLARNVGKLDLAIRLGEFAAERDPLMFWAQLNLAQSLFDAGRIEDSFRRFEIAASLNPSAGTVQWKLGLARLMIGDAQGALSVFEQEEQPMYKHHGRALAYHDLGRLEESSQLLEELTEHVAEYWPFGLARAHAWIGNADEAFHYLEATASTDSNVGMLGGAATNPLLQKLHNDPRWMPFLRSVGQAPEQLAAFEFNVKVPD